MSWGSYPGQNAQVFQAELEMFLKSYFELYSSNSAQCLFKWPVYVDQSAPVGRIAIANTATLTERDHHDLSQMISTAEATLARGQPGTKGVLAVGLEVIAQKIDTDAKAAADLERIIASDFEEPLKEFETRTLNEFKVKVAKIREKNYQLLEKTLRLEEKFQHYAKRTNSFDVKVSTATEAEGVISECAGALNDFESRSESLRYFADQKQNFLALQGDEGNKIGPERLKVLMKKDKNYLLDYLEKMKHSIEALHDVVAECERDAKELSGINDR